MELAFAVDGQVQLLARRGRERQWFTQHRQVGIEQQLVQRRSNNGKKLKLKSRRNLIKIDGIFNQRT
jgi:hypothetical protein